MNDIEFINAKHNKANGVEITTMILVIILVVFGLGWMLFEALKPRHGMYPYGGYGYGGCGHGHGHGGYPFCGSGQGHISYNYDNCGHGRGRCGEDVNIFVDGRPHHNHGSGDNRPTGGE